MRVLEASRTSRSPNGVSLLNENRAGVFHIATVEIRPAPREQRLAMKRIHVFIKTVERLEQNLVQIIQRLVRPDGDGAPDSGLGRESDFQNPNRCERVALASASSGVSRHITILFLKVEASRFFKRE